MDRYYKYEGEIGKDAKYLLWDYVEFAFNDNRDASAILDQLNQRELHTQ